MTTQHTLIHVNTGRGTSRGTDGSPNIRYIETMAENLRLDTTSEDVLHTCETTITVRPYGKPAPLETQAVTVGRQTFAPLVMLLAETWAQSDATCIDTLEHRSNLTKPQITHNKADTWETTHATITINRNN